MSPLFLLFGMGNSEMLLIFGVALLFFGGQKLPELMRGLGKGIKEFNNARANVEDEIRSGMRGDETPTATVSKSDHK
jgi:sec-independent protein translocase protein TatA